MNNINTPYRTTKSTDKSAEGENFLEFGPNFRLRGSTEILMGGGQLTPMTPPGYAPAKSYLYILITKSSGKLQERKSLSNQNVIQDRNWNYSSPYSCCGPVSMLWEPIPTRRYYHLYLVLRLLANHNFLVEVLVHQLSYKSLKKYSRISNTSLASIISLIQGFDRFVITDPVSSNNTVSISRPNPGSQSSPGSPGFAPDRNRKADWKAVSGSHDLY